LLEDKRSSTTNEGHNIYTNIIHLCTNTQLSEFEVILKAKEQIISNGF